MASLLVSWYTCIDETDGAGMNIMDIDSRQSPAAAGRSSGYGSKFGRADWETNTSTYMLLLWMEA